MLCDEIGIGFKRNWWKLVSPNWSMSIGLKKQIIITDNKNWIVKPWANSISGIIAQSANYRTEILDRKALDFLWLTVSFIMLPILCRQRKLKPPL